MTSVHVYCRLFLHHIILFSTPSETVFGRMHETTDEGMFTKPKPTCLIPFLEIGSRIYIRLVIINTEQTDHSWKCNFTIYIRCCNLLRNEFDYFNMTRHFHIDRICLKGLSVLFYTHNIWIYNVIQEHLKGLIHLLNHT